MFIFDWTYNHPALPFTDVKVFWPRDLLDYFLTWKQTLKSYMKRLQRRSKIYWLTESNVNQYNRKYTSRKCCTGLRKRTERIINYYKLKFDLQFEPGKNTISILANIETLRSKSIKKRYCDCKEKPNPVRFSMKIHVLVMLLLKQIDLCIKHTYSYISWIGDFAILVGAVDLHIWYRPYLAVTIILQ